MTARFVAVLAGLFGLVTCAAGTRVLSGSDPGYVVFRPLLVFNTVMGLVYVVAAVQIWRHARRGRAWALAIALVNLVVLVAVGGLYATGASVAVDSLRAMTFRMVAWSLAALALGRTR